MAASDDLNIEFLTIPQGSHWRRAWPILDESGDPVDLTGATAHASVARFPGDTPLYEWTLVNGGMEIDTDNSYVIMNVTPVVSAAWTWSHGVYDILLTEDSGTVTRIVQGIITVDKGVTS